jgi:hypothetical protein
MTTEIHHAVEHLAELPLPYDIVHACGKKAIAMAAELHLQGFDPDRLGTAQSFIPDLSATGLIDAYNHHATMHTESKAVPDFSKRLTSGVGKFDSETKCVTFDSALSIKWDDASTSVRVEGSGPDQQWNFPAPGEPIHFSNHTALLVDGMVVDPSYERARPLTLAEWKLRQAFPDAVIMTGPILERTPPFHLHTELLSETGRALFKTALKAQGLSAANLKAASAKLDAQPEAYVDVMSDFLRLQSDVPDDKRPRDAVFANHYEYACILRSAIFKGENYFLTDRLQDSRQVLADRINWLAPVYSYQRWLEETATLPDPN